MLRILAAGRVGQYGNDLIPYAVMHGSQALALNELVLMCPAGRSKARRMQ